MTKSDTPSEQPVEPRPGPGPTALGPLPALTPEPSALAAVLPEIKLMSGMVTGTIIVAALYFGREILMPLALAFLLGFVLDPLVGRLKRWGLPRIAAIAVVVTLTLALLGLAGLLLGKQVSVLSEQLPTYQTNITEKFRSLGESIRKPGMFAGATKTLDTVKAEVGKALAPKPEAGIEAEPDGSSSASAAPPVPVQVVENSQSPLQQMLPWLEAGGIPLANAGIVLVFMVLVLLDRQDQRDRLLRLLGGNLHRATDAMDEAGERISKYLTMQLLVNVTYGVPMAAGLWFIGVPGAILWGAVAAIMRFVPYVGPMISAVFPIALAFAVDPGWTMVLWTVALIVTLELISNNIIEPWLYGSSTGLSVMSLMVAATFWTALWGPIGLIMSTPLTVCLLVIGRHLPRLNFLNVLLGSQPALDAPTRLYQRLLADEVEEAIELATEQIADGDVTAFYNETGLPVLRMASSDHASVATAEHRHNVVTGMDALIEDLIEQYPPAATNTRMRAVCIGGKWEVDTLAARMLAHALSRKGLLADHRPAAMVSGDYIARLDLAGADTVCISYFSPEPRVPAKHFCRRLKRRWPHVKIVLALWNAPAELLGEEACKDMAADAVVTSLGEAVVRASHLMGAEFEGGFMSAPVPDADTERLNALRVSGALDARAQPLFDAASKRAADVFDVPMAMVSLIEEKTRAVRGLYGGPPGEAIRPEDLNAPRRLSLCGHVVANAQTMVVPDVAQDLRFAANPALKAEGLRFYAGAPMRDAGGHVLGTLCILDFEPRALTQREVRLLELMADELMEVLRTSVVQWGDVTPIPEPVGAADSATLGQAVPTAT